MPRRNSAPVQRQQRRYGSLPRRGAILTVWNSLGQPIEARVVHANHKVIDLVDTTTGEKTWIPARGYAS